MSIEFIHCADLHAGIKSYQKEYDGRLKDWEKAFQSMITYIALNNFPYCFIVGDLFHSANPDVDTIVTVKKCLSQLSLVCKKIFLVAGNHDINSLSQSRHILESAIFDNVIILDRTQLIEEEDFYVAHYHFLTPDISLTTDGLKPVIVTFHGNIEGAVDDKGHSAGEAQISSERLLETNPSYIALGHIHKRQDLLNNIAHYSGSFIQTSFAERNIDKGFLHVKHPSHIMWSIKESVSGLTSRNVPTKLKDLSKLEIKFIKNNYIEYEVIDSEEDLLQKNIENKIIKINYNMPLIQKEKYKDLLNSAYFVTYGITRDISQSNITLNIKEEETIIQYEEIDVDSLIKENLCETKINLINRLVK